MGFLRSDALSIPKEKVTSYLLSPTHEDGRHKAAFFLGYGFTTNDPDDLADALRKHAADHEIAKVENRPHGTCCVVEGDMKMPDGRTALIRAIWYIDNGSDITRFVTAYPLKKRNS